MSVPQQTLPLTYTLILPSLTVILHAAVVVEDQWIVALEQQRKIVEQQIQGAVAEGLDDCRAAEEWVALRQWAQDKVGAAARADGKNRGVVQEGVSGQGSNVLEACSIT
mgnify:CR=1 FL=1